MLKRKKRALTLVELMLVIVLIGVVSGALAFNLKGAVGKGKTFKSKEIGKKIEMALNMALLEDSPQVIESDWVSYVKSSSLLKLDPSQDKILDGSGKAFKVKFENDEFVAYTD